MATIAIDATSALAQGGGIGRLTRGLLRGLAELAPPEPFTLLRMRGTPAPEFAMPTSFRWQRLPLSYRESAWLWQRLSLPLPADWLCGRPALYHAPDYVLPPLAGARGIVTVHDLSYEVMPEVHVPSLRSYLQRAVPRSVARADHVFADSESTKQAISHYYGTAPAKISVVYPGIDARFRPLSRAHEADRQQLDAVAARYRIERPFVVGLGTMEPRKNFTTLISAYAQLRAAGQRDVALLLVGGGGWMNQRAELEAQVARLGLGDSVRFMGFVPDEDLPALINLARVMVYPSLYEGFGFPVLEALACGVPVVTSRNSSLPEAGGDAARYVEDPLDRDALADAIAALLDDEPEREQRRMAGLAHAATFTWAATARSALAHYRRLLG